MKKLSETYKELGIAFSFPIKIKDANGKKTYYESSNDYWYRVERDAKGNETYYEDSNGYWQRRERDANGNDTYYEDSDGYWYRSEYDANDNQTYHEDSNDFWQKWERGVNGNVTYSETSDGYKRGTPRSAKTCEGKVVEVDGVKYELKALHITADCHEEGGEFFVTDQSGNGNHAKFNHSQQS